MIQALLGALTAEPDNHAVRAHVARLLLDAGRPDEALDQATTVLAAVPDHVDALRVASAAARAVGDDAKAVSYGRLADALSPPPASAPPAPIRASAVPDTADEILQQWADEEAVTEPPVGPTGVTLADIGGLAEVKKRLELSFLAPLRNPELSLRFGKSLRGGLLLWGPPGCGKTLIARALAGELGANFYEIGLNDVLDMWIGSSERNLHAIFDTARRNRPCVLFFDEMDALGQKRSNLRGGGSSLRGVVNQMLAELDGASTNNEGVFVLAASNHPWDIDTALLRPGRFDRSVLVLPPDAEAREAILRFHLRGRPTERLDLGKIAKATDGMSGADLALICEQATENALDETMASGRHSPITQRHLQEAARSVRPSIGEWMETARNYALYGNDAGAYDELAAYLKKRRR
ncbi:ATPase family protein associated with various cellular activities (AAA) [Saccharothrix variisporea]|uniref:ATPase family protein associated with various cellular activities (AAA) n=1 Tax=Saccharothrix variisporea TaxID=543527 RepID=A0A495X654_9PSEU|nr:ATPase family protein associated with various cellular activities (AAA) [Saccharothrix variisporea]